MTKPEFRVVLTAGQRRLVVNALSTKVENLLRYREASLEEDYDDWMALIKIFALAVELPRAVARCPFRSVCPHTRPLPEALSKD